MQAILYPKHCVCLVNLNKTIEDALINFVDNIYVLNLFSFKNNLIKIKFNYDVKCLLESSIINSYHKNINIINSYIKNTLFYNVCFIFNKNFYIKEDIINFFDQNILYKYIYKYIKRIKYIEYNKNIFLTNQLFLTEEAPDGNIIELLYKIKNKYK